MTAAQGSTADGGTQGSNAEGSTPGRVYLVGAGPGSLDLVTLRARELIPQADVLVYDYLCNAEMLNWARADVEIIYAGKSASAHTLTQDEINALLVQKARAGKTVVRLKGGDPYVFGRGGEEAQVLVQAGVPFEVVPGVTSAIAAPAYAGIPVTHRDFASTVTFVTGHEDPTKTESSIDWAHLAGLRGTKIFLMGVERLRDICQRLMAEGAAAATPVALVRWGTTARQEAIEGTLATIADAVEKRSFKPPALIIVGEVVKLRTELNWFEALPLFGKRIVVTRTRKQASSLTRRLAQLGADVLEIPTIRIVPCDLTAAQRQKLLHIGEFFDWLVFTSPNAVGLFFQEMFRERVDIRSLGKVKIAVIGPGTRQKLLPMQLTVDLMPKVHTVEELTKQLGEMEWKGRRVCLPHGNLADPLLATQLREKGAEIEEWILYRTEPEDNDLSGARARFLREGAHWITFTSSSTAENWNVLKLHPEGSAPRPKAISLGPVTSETLRKLGYEVAAEAPTSTIDSLVETICKLNIE
jgi:uroporphyrinogen III methyltransferase/synthase